MVLALDYFMVNNPGASTGLVPSVGVSLGLVYDTYENLFTELSPRIRAYYFITERIAPYLMIQPTLWFPTWAGEDFDIEYTQLTVRAYIGFSFHIPSKDVVLSSK